MPLWYTLKVSPNSNILDIVNYFYSTSYFQDVDPGFMTNYTNNCITDDEFGNQWGLNGSSGIAACDAWNISRGSSCIVVAVVDQGIDDTHDEFSTNLLNLSYDAQDDSSPAQLHNNHGTHVAGIIGANQNGNQISGVAPMTGLMAISHPLITTSTISAELASGISWAWQNGADIINNSWGDQGGMFYNDLQSALLEDAIDDALENGRNGLGCIVVFASGNQAPAIDYPAYYNSDILCVGSVNSSGSRAPSSGYGTSLDIVAPGVDILSTLPGNQTGNMSGTSMAAPHVAGVAALILSINPSLTQDQVRDAIESSCDKVGSYSYTTTSGRTNGTWDDKVGYGKVNANAALLSVLPTISGSTTVCSSSNTTYTLNNLPSGSTVTWTKSSNLSYVSQGTNTYTVKASSSSISGSGWVEAEIITGNCDPITFRKDFWVGTPLLSANAITFNNESGEDGFFCTDMIGNDVSWPYSYPYNYFDVKVTNISGTQTYHTDRVYETNAFIGNLNLMSGTYMVGVQGTNFCGTGNWALNGVEWKKCSEGDGGIGGFFLNVTPNPTTTETEVELMRNDEVPIDDNTIWELEVYDLGMKLKTKDIKIHGNKHKISAQSWKEGIYVIRAYINDEVVTKIFIKK